MIQLTRGILAPCQFIKQGVLIMNYLEIINKCLSELSFKQVSDFSELVKPEHQRIKNYINIIAQEVCSSENWNFLLKEESLTLPAQCSEITNTINGKIIAVYIENAEYKFCEDFKRFLQKKEKAKVFSIFNDKLLFPEFEKEQTVKIIYYTRNWALSSDNKEKSKLEEATDISIIPQQYIEPILVYGTSMRIKGDPQYIKYNFWQSMYNSAIAAMRSEITVDANYSPALKLFRK